jgi:hypothetical protein
LFDAIRSYSRLNPELTGLVAFDSTRHRHCVCANMEHARGSALALS